MKTKTNIAVLEPTETLTSVTALAAESRDAASILNRLLAQCGFEVTGTQSLSGRAAKFAPIPQTLHPLLRDRLDQCFPDDLYAHQTLAIQESLAGTR